MLKPTTTVSGFRQRAVLPADVDQCPQQVRALIEGEWHTVNITYKRGDKAEEETHPLTPEWVRSHRPENFVAIREMVNSRHKSNKPGLTYFASTNHLVSHESRLESLALILLDWEGATQGIAAQPFTLRFNRSRKPTEHTPDYFARLHDGDGVVIDVKPRAFLTDADVTLQHHIAEEVALTAGWRYRVISEPPQYLARNLWLLAGYRLPHPMDAYVQPHLVTALSSGPLTYTELADVVADSMDTTSAVIKPHILHGLWTRNITTQLDHELTGSSVIALTKGVRQ